MAKPNSYFIISVYPQEAAIRLYSFHRDDLLDVFAGKGPMQVKCYF